MFFEALAVGRPVISTYIAAHPELIESGVNGWLVPAGAVDPLVDAMAEALSVEPLRLEEMGRAGTKRVAEEHNVYSEVGKLVALFCRGDTMLPQLDDHSKPLATQRDTMVAS